MVPFKEEFLFVGLRCVIEAFDAGGMGERLSVAIVNPAPTAIAPIESVSVRKYVSSGDEGGLGLQ